VREIAEALELSGAQLPMKATAHFKVNHLDCELWQEGETIMLAQFDKGRAVGCWKASLTEVLSNL
jgi:hypothetical protein